MEIIKQKLGQPARMVAKQKIVPAVKQKRPKS